VIKKTNETAAQVFPVMLDVENPEFYAAGCLCKNNEVECDQTNTPKFLQFFEAAFYISNGWQFLRHL